MSKNSVRKKKKENDIDSTFPLISLHGVIDMHSDANQLYTNIS